MDHRPDYLCSKFNLSTNQYVCKFIVRRSMWKSACAANTSEKHMFYIFLKNQLEDFILYLLC